MQDCQNQSYSCWESRKPGHHVISQLGDVWSTESRYTMMVLLQHILELVKWHDWNVTIRAGLYIGSTWWKYQPVPHTMGVPGHFQVVVPVYRQLLRGVHLEVGVHRRHVHDSCLMWRSHRNRLHTRSTQENLPLLSVHSHRCSQHSSGCRVSLYDSRRFLSHKRPTWIWFKFARILEARSNCKAAGCSHFEVYCKTKSRMMLEMYK